MFTTAILAYGYSKFKWKGTEVTKENGVHCIVKLILDHTTDLGHNFAESCF
jgi:hypothetical protein